MRAHRHPWACLLVTCTAVTLAGPGCRDRRPVPPGVTINGKAWFVELATTPDRQLVGLAGRDHLADNEGMLFIFPRAEVLNFCMRGCVISLDIAFIGDDMRVVRTHTMLEEPDRIGKVLYSSDVPARYALEVAAGSLERAGVKVGDPVSFSRDILADR